MDFSPFKKLNIGGVDLKELLIDGLRIWKSGPKNWVRYSTESDGKTIYNGGLGYKDGYRVRSGGAEGELDNGSCTGFIPVKGGDIVLLSGWDFPFANNGNAINVSDSNYTNIGQFTMLPAQYGILNNAYSAYSSGSVVKVSDNVYKWVVPPDASGVRFIRVSGVTNIGICPGSKMIVTINEEIT